MDNPSFCIFINRKALNTIMRSLILSILFSLNVLAQTGLKPNITGIYCADWGGSSHTPEWEIQLNLAANSEFYMTIHRYEVLSGWAASYSLPKQLYSGNSYGTWVRNNDTLILSFLKKDSIIRDKKVKFLIDKDLFIPDSATLSIFYSIEVQKSLAQKIFRLQKSPPANSNFSDNSFVDICEKFCLRRLDAKNSYKELELYIYGDSSFYLRNSNQEYIGEWKRHYDTLTLNFQNPYQLIRKEIFLVTPNQLIPDSNALAHCNITHSGILSQFDDQYSLKVCHDEAYGYTPDPRFKRVIAFTGKWQVLSYKLSRTDSIKNTDQFGLKTIDFRQKKNDKYYYGVYSQFFQGQYYTSEVNNIEFKNVGLRETQDCCPKAIDLELIKVFSGLNKSALSGDTLYLRGKGEATLIRTKKNK